MAVHLVSLVILGLMTTNKGQQEKKGKGRKGTKSHASVIFHLFVGKQPANRFSPNSVHHEICWT